jgi:hypothetical protein
MLQSRRDKPLYLVYDEDTFLTEPNGGFNVAPEARSPSAGRPHASRRTWKGGLVVAVAAATTAQLIAARVNDDQGDDRRGRPMLTRELRRPVVRTRHPALVVATLDRP